MGIKSRDFIRETLEGKVTRRPTKDLKRRQVGNVLREASEVKEEMHKSQQGI